MAQKKIAPVIKLTPDMKKRLDTSKEDLERAEASILFLKTLGIDTTELEEKIKWAKQVQTTLLKEFV